MRKSIDRDGVDLRLEVVTRQEDVAPALDRGSESPPMTVRERVGGILSGVVHQCVGSAQELTRARVPGWDSLHLRTKAEPGASRLARGP